MHDLPADWGALCALVLLLGLRHGLDADHLAAIDGLTRVGARQRRPHARYSGALFSLGHGTVVMAIALLAGLLGSKWMPPAWFETLGAVVSIGFLALIGAVNLEAVLRAAPGAVVPLVGLRGRLVERLLAGVGPRSGPLVVMGVGALFALSFDTLSQSALFAVMAVRFGGVEHAATLGLLFVLGMLVADGANGWWISRLIERTDRLAVLASRVMTAAVAGISLLVAALGTTRLLSERFEQWSEGTELGVGIGVIALVALSYVVACRVARARPVRAAAAADPAS
ncbi:MAG: nickel/cobalt efflux system [Pseudomonadota bacterium]|nr:nickel transporter [Rubrivivax sp.]